VAEKRMLILPADLVKKIDNNRGDMSQSEFVNFLIDSQLKQETKEPQNETQYATKEEVYSMEQNIKTLLRSFLDFFFNYGLELGKQTSGNDLEELTSKLQGLQNDLDSDGEEGKATIKWK
jgi:deoxyxylulose-5-phosphate synthase